MVSLHIFFAVAAHLHIPVLLDECQSNEMAAFQFKVSTLTCTTTTCARCSPDAIANVSDFSQCCVQAVLQDIHLLSGVELKPLSFIFFGCDQREVWSASLAGSSALTIGMPLIC